jgi:hypothetical protein
MAPADRSLDIENGNFEDSKKSKTNIVNTYTCSAYLCKISVEKAFYFVLLKKEIVNV